MSNVNIINFIKQVKQEASKVVYPERKEVFITSIIVIVILLLFSLFFLATDAIILKVVQFILKIGG